MGTISRSTAKSSSGRNNRSVHPCEVPVDPQERRIARRKVQIRTVIGVQQMKKIVYFCHA